MNITVGDLKRHLAQVSDDHEIAFGGGLTFYRLKQRGENLTVLEFNEPQGHRDDAFQKRNPYVCAVFMRLPVDPNADISGPFDVSLR